MPLSIVLNGQDRVFDTLTPPVTLDRLIAELALKGDRIAVELNGSIAERSRWAETNLASGDKLELVHFVGGEVAGIDRCGRLQSRIAGNKAHLRSLQVVTIHNIRYRTLFISAKLPPTSHNPAKSPLKLNKALLPPVFSFKPPF